MKPLTALFALMIALFAWLTPASADYLPSAKQLKQLGGLLKLAQPIQDGEEQDGTPILIYYIEVGKRYQPGYVAYFAKRGNDIYWKLEHFELRPDGNFLMTAWVFHPNMAVNFTPAVLTPTGSYIGSDGQEENFSIDDPIAIKMSEFTQRLLLKAKGWM